ncbi:unnamed protein product [Phytophthora lilii]|uniref:Unnamed protein product n=1 Tax=Phytophthora lilii TaxID=2077276 RepID=A0A9W6TD48_9STRA|nr:unnamed protein product [Phytophthora lilii]
MTGQRAEDPDEDDLLANLDVAYRREQIRSRVQRSRTRKKRRIMQEIDPMTAQCFQPLSEKEKYHCMELLRVALGADGLDECTCKRIDPMTAQCFQPLSEKEKYHCMELLRVALGADGLDECTCAICDRLVLQRDVERKDGSD